MEQNEFDEKIKYAQNIINILQTKLNESVAQSVQFEATTIKLKEDIEKLTEENEKLKQEPIDGNSNQAEEE
jgi:FtsZ-binding cell division protein ZapB